MDPTSRNRVLMIGGALIVIALLLVCGPLQDRIGSDRSGTPLPPVAAGPPEPSDAAAERAPVQPAPEAAPAPAVEPAVEESALAPAVAAMPVVSDSAAGGDAGLETAAAAGAAAAGASAAVETAASAPSAAAELPSVSAAPPPSPTAAAVFDDALAATSLGSARDEVGVGPAGAAAERFAPPVASGPVPLGIQAAQQFGIDSSLRRPCDTPGSGCQNLVSAGGTGNPPIRPGVRPVPPPNPPIRPGTRPTP